MILIGHLVVFIPHSTLMGEKLAKNSIKSVFWSSQHWHSVAQNGLGAGHDLYGLVGLGWTQVDDIGASVMCGVDRHVCVRVSIQKCPTK